VIRFHREAERGKALARSYDYVIVGAKQSGIGDEMGREGLEKFTQVTTVNKAR
jgi:acyl-CoA reductase-like NAD-dependent aldehyde dehydrogenase